MSKCKEITVFRNFRIFESDASLVASSILSVAIKFSIKSKLLIFDRRFCISLASSIIRPSLEILVNVNQNSITELKNFNTFLSQFFKFQSKIKKILKF